MLKYLKLLSLGLLGAFRSDALLDQKEDNNTLFSKAVAQNRTDVVHELLQSGVIPNVVDAKGRTPLLTAVGTGNVFMAGLLLAKGADPNQVAVSGTRLPLIEAAYTGKHELVKLLLEKGANPNAKTSHGATALYAALMCKHDNMCKTDNYFTVKLLLEGGAHTLMPSINGVTPFEIVSRTIEYTGGPFHTLLLPYTLEEAEENRYGNTRPHNEIMAASINPNGSLTIQGDRSKAA